MNFITRSFGLNKAAGRRVAVTLLLAASLIAAPLAVFHGSSAYACAPAHHCEYYGHSSWCSC